MNGGNADSCMSPVSRVMAGYRSVVLNCTVSLYCWVILYIQASQEKYNLFLKGSLKTLLDYECKINVLNVY